VIVTLVATLASSMVWQQWRAVQVEGAERVRSQAGWVLSGALDWARLILREDAKSSQAYDHLGEPWALPLAEARLSTFLAADKDNSASDNDDAPEAFLSGKVEDAESKYNLRNLMGVNAQTNLPDIEPLQLDVLRRLCENIGLSRGLADGIAQSFLKANLAFMYNASRDPNVLAKLGGDQGRAQAPLLPTVFDDIAWLGLDAGTVEKLRPYVTLLKDQSGINMNTASREVIAAVVDMDMGTAGRIVQARQRKPFKILQDSVDVAGGLVGQAMLKLPSTLLVQSQFFEVSGRLRYEDNIIEQRHLVFRDLNDVTVLHQSRFSGIEQLDPGPTAP
jgi:general secretion pathway protein K